MSNVSRIPVSDSSVVIRVATTVDLDELRRVAALDSARALLGTVLVAESDGRIRAALSVDEDRAVADPFVPTAAFVELLRTRAALLRGSLTEPARRPLRARLTLARS